MTTDDPGKMFVPADEARELSKAASAQYIATSEMMKTMADLLPDDRYEMFTSILESGGRVGIETTIDKSGARKMVLIGIRTDGGRYEAGELVLVGDRPSAR